VPRLRLGLNPLHQVEIRDQPLRDGRAPPPRLFPLSHQLSFWHSTRPSHAKVLSAVGLLNWPAVLKSLVKLTSIKAAKSQIELQEGRPSWA
jgi:hypothetical protein